MISKSQARGESSFFENPPLIGLVSKSLCRVLASILVHSKSLLAARPVGAASAILNFLVSRILRMELTKVVLPTPGPPVITRTFDVRAISIACFWV